MDKSVKKKSKKVKKNSAKGYQKHVTINSTTIESEDTYEKIVYMEDLEKRKEVYGICEECSEPRTGKEWCQLCNAKRFKENFKNWTSGNKDIDKLIKQTQLNAIHYRKYIEWIPFENFIDVTYITKGGFGKIYSAKWPEGFIKFWDTEKQKWFRRSNIKVALKSLDDSSDISTDFLNEIKSYLQIYIFDVVQCYGITQDPVTKDYMMVLYYCEEGNLRSYYLKKQDLNYELKIEYLFMIARGLVDIHNAGKVHKDFHSGNILFNSVGPFIGDLGMCQPANNKVQLVGKEEIFGVLPYMAPEVLCGHEYTKASDIYSFGIIMNEFISEEIPYNNIPHDHILAVKICKGLRPKIPEDTSKLLADLIVKCWDAKAENRPTAKEIYLILDEKHRKDSEIYFQINEYEKLEKNKLENTGKSNKNTFKNIQTHPKAFYTSRLLDLKNLPEPVNSPVSECIDCQLSELDLNEIN